MQCPGRYWCVRETVERQREAERERDRGRDDWDKGEKGWDKRGRIFCDRTAAVTYTLHDLRVSLVLYPPDVIQKRKPHWFLLSLCILILSYPTLRPWITQDAMSLISKLRFSFSPSHVRLWGVKLVCLYVCESVINLLWHYGASYCQNLNIGLLDLCEGQSSTNSDPSATPPHSLDPSFVKL